MDSESTIHKLWRVFNTKQHIMKDSTPCIYRSEQKPSIIKTIFKNIFPIRTVYAAEDDGNISKTSVEKIGQKCPAIHVSDEEVREYMNKETGMERVRDFFYKGEDGNPNPELIAMSFIIQTSAGIVFLVTSVRGARAAREAFLTKQHQVFPTRFKALRAYNDALIIGAFKVGGIWALKTLVFSTLFLFTSQSIAIYRNKSSVLEYIAGGALTGAVLRLNLGFRGFFAGGVIGSVLGTVCGTLFYLTQIMTGDTQEQRHHWHVQEKLRHRKELELLAKSEPGEKSNNSINQVSQPSPA